MWEGKTNGSSHDAWQQIVTVCLLGGIHRIIVRAWRILPLMPLLLHILQAPIYPTAFAWDLQLEGCVVVGFHKESDACKNPNPLAMGTRDTRRVYSRLHY